MSKGQENLRPVRSEEEAREKGRKGGIKSGESRRRKRSMKQAAKLLMDQGVTSPKLREQIKGYGIDDEDVTNQMAVMTSMLIQATKGNVRAAEFLRDVMGENAEAEIKRAELAQRKREFEYQKQKDAQQNEQAGNDVLKAWAEKVKAMRDEDSG